MVMSHINGDCTVPGCNEEASRSVPVGDMCVKHAKEFNEELNEDF